MSLSGYETNAVIQPHKHENNTDISALNKCRLVHESVYVYRMLFSRYAAFAKICFLCMKFLFNSFRGYFAVVIHSPYTHRILTLTRILYACTCVALRACVRVYNSNRLMRSNNLYTIQILI